MELVRVDRREVLLGPQARDVDGVLAVGEDLLVLARFGLALRAAASFSRCSCSIWLTRLRGPSTPSSVEQVEPIAKSSVVEASRRSLFCNNALWTTEESAYLSRPLVRFPGVVGSKGISFGPTTTTLIGC